MYVQSHFSPDSQMRKELEETIRKENSKQTEIEDLKERLDALKEANMQHYQSATSYNVIFERRDFLNHRLEFQKNSQKTHLSNMTVLKGKLV